MLNKTDFFLIGDKDEFYREARRYGTIQLDSQFDINEGPQAGAHRIITVGHHGAEFVYHLHNGKVVSIARVN